jgi:hypothetical protein
MQKYSTQKNGRPIINGDTPYGVLIGILETHGNAEQVKRPFLIKKNVRIIL